MVQIFKIIYDINENLTKRFLEYFESKELSQTEYLIESFNNRLEEYAPKNMSSENSTRQ